MKLTEAPTSQIELPPQWAGKSIAIDWAILWLFVGSFCIRLAVGSFLGLGAKPESDEHEYYSAAASIARGDGYRLVPQQSPDGVARPTAFRLPGPSLIVALALKITGMGIPAARLVSVIFGAAAAPFMYLFARQFTSWPAALLAGAAVALHPVWNFMATAIESEPYFLPLLILSLWLTACSWRKSGRLAILAGLSWGIAMLMRPHALPMAALIVLLAIASRRWQIAALLSVGFLAAALPWTVRNYVEFHRFEPLETVSGETFLGANNPYVISNPALHGMWISPMGIPQYRSRLAGVHDDFQRRDIQRSIALQFLSENRTEIPRLVFYKIWRWLTPITGSRGIVRWLVLLSYGLLLALLAVGLPLGVFKPTIELKLAILCTLALLTSTIVYWGILTRGRLLLEFIWLPWACAAACRMFQPARKLA
jgi:4-amino-4-deoxy-L-arabinose transferase-like glycosyltransferase